METPPPLVGGGWGEGSVRGWPRPTPPPNPLPQGEGENRGGKHADSHARPDTADCDHRLLSAAVVVRRQPQRTLVQVRAGRVVVPRAIPRRRSRDHQRAGGGGAR